MYSVETAELLSLVSVLRVSRLLGVRCRLISLEVRCLISLEVHCRTWSAACAGRVLAVLSHTAMPRLLDVLHCAALAERETDTAHWALTP